MCPISETEPYNPPAHAELNNTAITFLLAGRTTLSEHTPGETITVEYSIVHRSPYLRNFLPSQITSLSSATQRTLAPIRLPSFDPAGFAIYIHYLRTSLIRPPVPNPTHQSLTLYACTPLLYAHMLGTVISAPHFQDRIIDTLSELLDTVQAPDLRVLELLYLEDGVSNVLRGYVVNFMFGWERRMLVALRGGRFSGGGGGSDWKTGMESGIGTEMGCKYHVHDRGMCYKDLVDGDGRREEAEWGMGGDAGVNVLAAQFLGKEDTNSQQGSSKTIDRKATRTDKLQSEGLQYRTAYEQLQAVSTTPTASYNTAGLYLSKPLPPLPSIQGLFLEARDKSSSNTYLTGLPIIPKSMALYDRFTLLDVNRDEDMGVRSHDYKIESPCEAKCESSSFSSLLPTSSLEVEDDYDHERKEAHETRDSVLHLNDDSTTTLARSFSFTPLPTPTRYLPPSTSLPRSASLMIDLSSNPFTQHSVPPTPISPTTIATQPKHRTTTLLYRIVTPSNLDFAQLIKRKPAPARGQDWVDQWNKLFAIQGTQGFGLRKVFDERKKGKGHRWVAMVGEFGDRIK